MLLLFPGNPKGLLQALGVLDPKVYGLLLSPRRTATKSGLRGLKYGVDNGCFTGAFEPLHFKRILARLKRVVEFYKSHGCRYFAIDTDGNPEAVVPMFMDAGVDILWPLERASDQDPVRLRKKFGKSLRLWGGVDKRVLAEGPDAIDTHLRALRPLVEEGGYIPTVDHTVPPDISWPNFQHYIASKAKLLRGEL